MFDYAALWGLATIVGPLLLLGAMVYGVLMYRRRSQASKRQTEAVTRTLYREGSEHERRQEAMEGTIESPPLAPGASRDRSSVGSRESQR